MLSEAMGESCMRTECQSSGCGAKLKRSLHCHVSWPCGGGHCAKVHAFYSSKRPIEAHGHVWKGGGLERSLRPRHLNKN